MLISTHYYQNSLPKQFVFSCLFCCHVTSAIPSYFGLATPKFKIRLTEEKEEMTSNFQTPPNPISHKSAHFPFYKETSQNLDYKTTRTFQFYHPRSQLPIKQGQKKWCWIPFECKRHCTLWKPAGCPDHCSLFCARRCRMSRSLFGDLGCTNTQQIKI